MPYGEECIRVNLALAELEPVCRSLIKAAEGAFSPSLTAEIFEKAVSIIEDACSTLNDCKPLPPEDGDE